MVAGRDYLGAYRLVRLVRSGQTCQIWDAVDDSQKRRVAIKMLLPEFRKDREQIEYLKHEREVGKGLDHPAVIQIHAFGVVSGIPHLVMELFDSRNLKQRLRDEPDQLAEQLPGVIRQAAEGLAHLHDQGWVHCDVKPDNFLVNAEGQVKLIDFALARRLPRGLGKLFGGRPKAVQGTRSYMSPEQIRCQRLDQRADVYSFGCMVYELLTGKPPFAASSPNELLNKHLRTPAPSPAAANANVTPEMAQLVVAMMAKQPEQRPQTMNEVLKTLERLRVFRVPPRAAGAEEGDGT